MTAMVIDKGRISECLDVFTVELLKRAAMIQDIGFLTGKTGVAVLLYYYAQYKRDAKMAGYAGHLIDLITEDISPDAGIDFEDGLCGTAWSINRLMASGFVQADGDILEDIDAEIFKDTKKTLGLEDFSEESWKGVYLLSRLQSADISENIWQQRMTEYFRNIRKILTLRYAMYSVPVFACEDLLPVFHACAMLRNDDRYTVGIKSLCEELPVITEVALREEKNYGDKFLLFQLTSQFSLFSQMPEIDTSKSITLMDVNRFYMNRFIFKSDIPTPKIISDALFSIVEDRKRIDELLFLLHPDNAGLGNYVGGLAWAMLQWCKENETYEKKNNKYAENRKDFHYVKRINEFLHEAVADECDSIIDVGSRGVDLISQLPIKNKVSIDLTKPLIAEGVKSITGDFFDYEPNELFDIVGCFQTLEHIREVEKFTDKLFTLSRKYVLISIPYKWSAKECKYHVHDPVDEEKLAQWTKRVPIYEEVVTDHGKRRLICVYKK